MLNYNCIFTFYLTQYIIIILNFTATQKNKM